MSAAHMNLDPFACALAKQSTEEVETLHMCPLWGVSVLLVAVGRPPLCEAHCGKGSGLFLVWVCEVSSALTASPTSPTSF